MLKKGWGDNTGVTGYQVSATAGNLIVTQRGKHGEAG